MEAEIKGQPGNLVVWVYLDGDEGVTLDKCADVSRELAFLLDAHEVFDGKYTLNVSSPGLSRPLKVQRQYLSNKGRKASVRFWQDEKAVRMKGELVGVTDTGFQIKTDKGKVADVPFQQVIETKILPAW